MALGPINYQMQVATPFESVLQGMRVGAQMADIEAARAAQAAKIEAQRQAMALAEQRQRAVADLFANPNPSYEQTANVLALLPAEQGKLIADLRNQMSDVQRKNYGAFTAKVVTGLLSERPEVATRLIEEHAAGERDPERRKQWETIKGIAEISPKDAAAMARAMGAGLFGKDWFESVTAITTAPPKPPEPAEVVTMRTLGFPMTPQGYADFRASQMKEPSTELTTLLADLEKAPPGSTKARVLQRRIDMLTTREPRGPSEGPAPTITQIQDPTNPERMITIDARRYQGGGVGSVGVIGASGKTAPAETAALKRQEGASQARDILDTLRASYEDLDRRKALPSDQRNFIYNSLAWIASTGPGQVAGRMAGTKEQTQRDVIASARNQLFVAVKNATGLSAQNLNSNVEFRTWLDSLTDPTRSYQANITILDNMERFIASGGKEGVRTRGGEVTPVGARPTEPAPATTRPPAQAPMFARNPQTGERIMSVDGGNTWTPAR